MKNIDELLKEAGAAIAEDKKAEFDRAFKANYKTVADYEKQKSDAESAKTSLQAQLDAAKEAMKGFEGIDPANLKDELAKAQQALKDAQAKYDSDIAKRDSRAETEKLLAAHKFINKITHDHYVDAVEKALDEPKNKGKGREELFKALTQDEAGKPVEGVFLAENPNRLPGPPPAGNIPRGSGDDIAAKVAARYAAAKAE